MPRKRVPGYRRQKGYGGKPDRAFVEVQGHRFTLGEYGTQESHRAYARFVAEWEASGGQLPAEGDDLTVEELAVRYLEWRIRVMPDSKMPAIDRTVLRRTIKLYGDLEINDFAPRHLKTVRHSFVRDGLARVTCNCHANRLKAMFRWGCEEGYVRGDTWHALSSVAPLVRGFSEAKESRKVGPADDADVDATLPYLSRPVQGIVNVVRATGMRAGEAVLMRPCDIDRSRDVWVYTPHRHKNDRFGHVRHVLLGPKAQEVLVPFLKGRPPGQYLFSPQEAAAEAFEKRHARRKTPLRYGNSPGTNRKKNPKIVPGERYEGTRVSQCIRRACLRAGVKWHLHQLRHTYATKMRAVAGVEHAQVLLGHSTLRATEIYAEKDLEAALEIVRKHG